MTLAEVAARLRMAERTLQRFLNRIGIRAIQAGDKSLLFTEADYLEIRETRRKRSARKPAMAESSAPPMSDAAISARLAALRAESTRPRRRPMNGQGTTR